MIATFTRCRERLGFAACGFIAVALLSGVLTVHAADFNAGVKAYEGADYATALRIFRQLADQGHAKAQFNLGYMYNKGQGVPLDYAVAVRWLRKAADQGDAWAQVKLGLVYEEGQGVTQDYVQAHMWYNLSAAKGDNYARMLRDRLAEKMTPAQIAEVQKLAREWKPKRE